MNLGWGKSKTWGKEHYFYGPPFSACGRVEISKARELGPAMGDNACGLCAALAPHIERYYDKEQG